MKTVRFSKVVQESGTPEPYTLWLPPERDRPFQAAVKAHRVMTVHQANTGTASDFGEIGFVEGVQGSYLLFPKSLKRYEGCRVIGVKYELLKETPPLPALPKAAKKPKLQPPPEVEPAAPVEKAEQKPKAKAKPATKPPAPARAFEPLRVFEPAAAKPEPAEAPEQDDASDRLRELTRKVRQALKKLEQGKTVAAFQILEEAISAS